MLFKNFSCLTCVPCLNLDYFIIIKTKQNTVNVRRNVIHHGKKRVLVLCLYAIVVSVLEFFGYISMFASN